MSAAHEFSERLPSVLRFRAVERGGPSADHGQSLGLALEDGGLGEFEADGQTHQLIALPFRDCAAGNACEVSLLMTLFERTGFALLEPRITLSWELEVWITRFDSEPFSPGAEITLVPDP